MRLSNEGDRGAHLDSPSQQIIHDVITDQPASAHLGQRKTKPVPLGLAVAAPTGIHDFPPVRLDERIVGRPAKERNGRLDDLRRE